MSGSRSPGTTVEGVAPTAWRWITRNASSGSRCWTSFQQLHRTAETWRRADMKFGMANPHWYFMAQPFDLPERMLDSDPNRNYLPHRDLFDPEALDDYLRCIRNPDTIHAMCEDYRAGATFDNDLDEADRGHRRITCPLLVLWSTWGGLSWWDPLAIWRGWADDVSGTGIDCGHYLAEEAPEETCRRLRDFFATG